MSINYYSFNGTNQAIDLGSLTFAGDFTIAFRLKPAAYSGSLAIPFASQSVGQTSYIQLYTDYIAVGDMAWDTYINGSDGANLSLGTLAALMPAGSDAFVVIARNGTTGAIKLYINGSPVDTEALYTISAGAVILAAMRLACRYNGTSNAAFLGCQIAQWGAWNVAWNSTDVNIHALGVDPTSIEWGNIVAYVPLQTATIIDVIGGAVSGSNSPALVGTAASFALSATSVAPSSVTSVSVTGSNTPWYGGSPSSAPLTVSAGSTGSDVVTTATTRSFSFTAPGTSGVVTVTDPATGATATIAVGSAINYASFDGATQAIDLGSRTFSGDFTILFRVKPNTYLQALGVPFASETGADYIQIYTDYPIADNLSWGANSFVTIGSLAALMPPGSDAFIAIVRSGSTVTLNINGSPANAQPFAGSATLNAMRLAGRYNGTAMNAFFACKAAQFGIFTAAIGSPDLANHALGVDPTLLTLWSDVVQYVPLQTPAILDVIGGAASPVGTPGFVGTAPTLALSQYALAPTTTATITVTGTGTTWASSSPPIVASAGTIASYTWVSATSVHFAFTAPASGLVTFTDLATGAQAILTTSVVGASAFTLTGPTTGRTGVGAVYEFTPTGGIYSGTIDPTATGLAGTWSPTVLTWAGTIAGQYATFTPSAGGTATINGTSGLTQPSSITLTVSMPTALIDFTTTTGAVSGIWPSGNVLVLFVVDGSGNPLLITGANLIGSTIEINGGAPIPISAIGNRPAFLGPSGTTVSLGGPTFVANWLWTFFGTPALPGTALIQSSVASLTPPDTVAVPGAGNSWMTQTVTSGLGKLFSFVVNDYGAMLYSTVSADTLTYTFEVPAGATVNVFRNFPDCYPGGLYYGPSGWNPTTDARWSITDGVTTTNVTRDLTVMETVIDDADLTYDWDLLATFMMGANLTTLTVTLSNQAGAGTLFAGALRVTRVCPKTVVPGDTVVLNMPDGAITTATHGTIGVVSQTLRVLADADVAPYDPTKPRIPHGFNAGPVGTYAFGRVQADLARNGGWDSSAYGGAFNAFLDPYTQQLFGAPSSSGQTVRFHFVDEDSGSTGIGNNFDYRCFPSYALSGDWTILCDIAPGGIVSVTMLTMANPGLTFSASGPGGMGGTYPSVSGTGNVLTFTQVRGNVFEFCPEVVVLLTTTQSGGHDWPTSWKILAPDTPSNWTKFSDYVNYNRLSGKFFGGPMRGMHGLGIDFGNVAAKWTEPMQETLGTSPPIPTLNWPYGVLPYPGGGSNITGIWPITHDATANAMAQVVFSPAKKQVCFLVEFDSSGHGITDQARLVTFALGGTNQGTFNDTQGNSFIINGAQLSAFIVDATKLICLEQQDASTGAGVGGLPTTLAAPDFPASFGDWSYSLTGYGALPYTAWIKFCNDMQMWCWLNLPPQANDDFGNQLGQACAADAIVNPAGYYPIEYTNEVWDPLSQESGYWTVTLLGRYANYLWLSTGGAQGTGIVGQGNFYAYRAIQLQDQVQAGFTGIPEVRIIGGGGQGATAVATIVSGVVTAITMATGKQTGYDYTFTPTVEILGGKGSGATATASAPVGGAITAITVTNGGSGYVTTGLDPKRIVRVMGSHYGDANPTGQALSTAWILNKNFDWLAVAVYVDGIPDLINFYDTVFTNAYLNDLLDRVDNSSRVDENILTYLYSGMSTLSHYHWDQIATYGSYFANVKMVCYEEAEQQSWVGNADPNGVSISRVAKASYMVVHDPRWYWIRKAIQQKFADPLVDGGYQISAISTFSLDGVTGKPAVNWNTFQGPTQPTGTGVEPITYNLSESASQKFGGMAEYAQNSMLFTGPYLGTTGSASAAFTITANELIGSNTITLHSDSGGTFSPAGPLSFSAGSSSQNFAHTAATDGVHYISITDSLGAMIVGSPIYYVTTPTPTGASGACPALSLSVPVGTATGGTGTDTVFSPIGCAFIKGS